MYYICSIVLYSRPQLRDLYTLITPNYAAHWKVIGTLLNIPEGRLDAIESGFPTNAVWCCNQMLGLWLKTNASVTWKDMVAVVDSPAVVSSVSSLQNYSLTTSEDIIGITPVIVIYL